MSPRPPVVRVGMTRQARHTGDHSRVASRCGGYNSVGDDTTPVSINISVACVHDLFTVLSHGYGALPITLPLCSCPVVSFPSMY